MQLGLCPNPSPEARPIQGFALWLKVPFAQGAMFRSPRLDYNTLTLSFPDTPTYLIHSFYTLSTSYFQSFLFSLIIPALASHPHSFRLPCSNTFFYLHISLHLCRSSLLWAAAFLPSSSNILVEIYQPRDTSQLCEFNHNTLAAQASRYTLNNTSFGLSLDSALAFVCHPYASLETTHTNWKKHYSDYY